ncbi:MAG: cation-translocating P-type ATPase, partial [Gammaproteobacteria bacterium]|nr:cation-translocating P-type ATPase [Gammaproteobacteria bacterium]
ELALYDLDEVQEEYVDSLSDNREIHLLVEGIHCAACVWLIENSLKAQPGVLDARVNLSGKRLLVKWDNARIQLSKILQRVGQIGYAAVPYDAEAAEGAVQRQNRDLLYRMAFAGFAMMNLLWISIALYSGADQGEFRSLFHWIGFLLATPTLLYSGYPFFKGAWTGLKQWHLGMDLPIVIGASITYLYSVYITLIGSTTGEVYYDTVVNFLFVILVGRYLEAMSKRQAVASTQRLLDLQPKVATVVRDDEERVVPIRSVKVSEVVFIRPGERIPVDGTILSGTSRIDESMLTGESEPLHKASGDTVSAGTINGSGPLRVEVTGLLKNSALGRIIQLVEEAQASRAPIQCMADRVVPWFVAITLGLAAGTFLWWFGSDFEKALLAATSVLIITCPCAFGLATPMSIAVASGLGAQHGVLVKNGEVLETLSNIDHMVFDKTGTLTEGRMSLAVIETAGQSWRAADEVIPEELKQLLHSLAQLESQSEHSIAQAILHCAQDNGLSIGNRPVQDFVYQPGAGVSGWVAGLHLVLGSADWIKKSGGTLDATLVPKVQRLDHQGMGVIHCAIDGQEIAVLGLQDQLRADAKFLVSSLKEEGMRLTLLSGDRNQTAEKIAEQLGGLEVIAEVLPQDKDRVIGELQKNHHRVAMVGDGVNDAPALVRADVGIALGSGTDVSIASADIVLMSSELEKVSLATALSRRTLRTIRQNITISLIYNIIMVPLAMMALITPLVAAVSMPISSLLVIANAARIRTLFSRHNVE